MNTSLGRYLFGISSIGLGICGLIWHDVSALQLSFGKISHLEILVYCFSVVQIAGGAAILIPRSARAGAAALAVLYGIFTLIWLPPWFRHHFVFDYLGNAFEQFAMCAGALIIYGPKTERIGYYGFGVSVISFAVYQAVHMDFTASLVPKWIPPGQMFWTVVTTIAFALAAVALLSGRLALLAARLTTLMIFAFGLLIWVPATFLHPSNPGDWGEFWVNYGICGAAWIVADYLAQRQAVLSPLAAN